MDRLEFNQETPVPVIKGTSYAEQFADRDAVRARINAAKSETTPSGPYSAIFDWKTEQADAAAQLEKKQAVQRKIMKTNALGDAFSLLSEGVGAFYGATVTPRNANPGIMKAVNDYAKNDQEYMQKLEGVKAKKLALFQADIQYNLNQDALTEAKLERQAERSRAEARSVEKELDDYIRQNKLLEKQFRLRGLESEAEFARKNYMEGVEKSTALELLKQKARYDRGWDLGNGKDGGIPQFDLLSPGTTKGGGKSNKIPFIVPDKPTTTVYLPPELIDEIRFQLIGPDGNKYDPKVSDALRAILRNKQPAQASLMQEIRKNWNEGANIKDLMVDFAPNAYEQIYGKPEDGAAAPQIKVNTKPAADTLADGTVVLDPWSVQNLQKRMFESLQDSTLDLSNDKSVKKKIIELQDMIYTDHKVAGVDMDENEALIQANNIMNKYRQKKRASTSK